MKLLIPLVIGVVAIVGVGAVIVSRQSSKPATDTGSMVEEADSPQSLRGLMSAATSQVCVFADEVGNSGTVYIGGGKMRGDFASQAQGQDMNSHMISDGSNIYMWFDTGAEGFKVSLAEIEKFSDFGEDGQKSVDLDAPVNFDCDAWAVDNSKFNLPSINFEDFGAMMEGIGNLTGEENALQCETCDSLPDEAAGACRQALGC